jgi:hypothetical protein
MVAAKTGGTMYHFLSLSGAIDSVKTAPQPPPKTGGGVGQMSQKIPERWEMGCKIVNSSLFTFHLL